MSDLPLDAQKIGKWKYPHDESLKESGMTPVFTGAGSERERHVQFKFNRKMKTELC